jgi:DNA primase
MRRQNLSIDGHDVRVTHPDKLYFSKQVKLTKLDLRIRKQYYTTTVGPVEYALVAMHVGSRQNPNWVWVHSNTK